MDVWRWWPYAAAFGSIARSMTPLRARRDEEVYSWEKPEEEETEDGDVMAACCCCCCSFSALDSRECAILSPAVGTSRGPGAEGMSTGPGRSVRFQSSSSSSSTRRDTGVAENLSGSGACSGSVWDGAVDKNRTCGQRGQPGKKKRERGGRLHQLAWRKNI